MFGNKRAMLTPSRVSSRSSRRIARAIGLRTKKLVSAAFFEYTGEAAMTMTGPVSGITYRFAGSGSRAVMDLRDWKSATAIPHLVRVNGV